MTESALATVPDAILITQFEALLSDIRIAQDKAATMPVFDFTSKEGNQAARAYVHRLRGLNGRIETARTEAKRFALDYGKAVDKGAKELRAQVAALIEPIQEGIDAVARAEAERVAGLQRRLSEAEGLGGIRYGATAADIQCQLDKLNGLSILDLQEYETPVLAAMTRSRKQLETALQQARAAEAQAAELARLKAEQEAREAELAAAYDRGEATTALVESAAEAEARLVDAARPGLAPMCLWGSNVQTDAAGNVTEIQSQPSAPVAAPPACIHSSSALPPGHADAAEQSRRRRRLVDQLLTVMGSMRREAVANAIVDGRLHPAVSVRWEQVQ